MIAATLLVLSTMALPTLDIAPREAAAHPHRTLMDLKGGIGTRVAIAHKTRSADAETAPMTCLQDPVRKVVCRQDLARSKDAQGYATALNEDAAENRE